jgi:hypothetical protein
MLTCSPPATFHHSEGIPSHYLRARRSCPFELWFVFFLLTRPRRKTVDQKRPAQGSIPHGSVTTQRIRASFRVDCTDLADFKRVLSSPKQSLAPNQFRNLGLGCFLPDGYARNAIAFNWALHSTCHPVLYVKPSHQLGTDAADTVLSMASK